MARKSGTPNTRNTSADLIAAPSDGALMARVVNILDQAQANVVRAVNSNMVLAYWLIGREIVTAVQGARAEQTTAARCWKISRRH